MKEKNQVVSDEVSSKESLSQFKIDSRYKSKLAAKSCFYLHRIWGSAREFS